jgi:hypothetical protein
VRERATYIAWNCLKALFALVIMLFMIVFAKIVQYTSVDVFKSELGFDSASLLGLAPVILAYFFIAIKLPKFTLFGRTYG